VSSSRTLGLVAALYLGAAACGDDDFAWEGEAGRPVAVEISAWVPIAPAGLVGGAEGRFLVDTGAPFTIFDRDSFATLGMDGVHEADVAAFDLVFPGYRIASWNLFGGAPGSGIPDGILGGDLVRHFALGLDYQGARAWLIDGYDGAARPSGAEDVALGPPHTVPFELVGGGLSYVPGECPPEPFCGTVDLPATRILVRARFERGDPVWVVVDTGASALAMPESFFATLGDAARPRFDGVTVTTATGVVEAGISRVGRIELVAGGDGPGATVTDVPILVLPTPQLFQSISDEVGEDVVALVGGTFLRQYLTVIDYPEERLVLHPYQQAPHVPADEYVGVGFTLVDGGGGEWIVGDVYSGTDAAAEGLVRGQIVDELGGTPIGGQSQSMVNALLGAYDLGQDVPVGVRAAGGAVETKQIAVEDLLPHYETP
jgi:hypothetical protein